MTEAVILGLRRVGFDCLSCDEAGNRTWTDEQQLTFASSVQRAILTRNASDFGRLHRDWILSGRTHHGIIVLSEPRTPPGVQIRALRNIDASLPDLRDSLAFLLNYI
jgi:hypothetical protein